MVRKLSVLVVGLALVSTSVLGLGAGTPAGPDGGGDGGGAGANATALQSAADRVERTFPGARIDADLGNGSGLDLSVFTDRLDVAFLNLGDDNRSTSAEISHPAVTEDVETETNAGLCATGLHGEDSPLNVSVDEENDSVFVVFDEYEPASSSDSESALNATGVVERCSTWNGT